MKKIEKELDWVDCVVLAVWVACEEVELDEEPAAIEGVGVGELPLKRNSILSPCFGL